MTQNIHEQSAITEGAIGRLAWARGFAESLIAAVPDDRLTFQPGGNTNHALWIIGHLAATDDAVLMMCTGQPSALPESYDALFRGRDRPSPNAGAYPSEEELFQAMRDRRAALLAWVEGWDDGQAFTPAPDELQAFAPDWVQTLYALAAHDLFHAGQVATCRAALGMGVIHR